MRLIRLAVAQRYGTVRLGDVGIIRQITTSDPDDGDETFLMFDVAMPGGTVLLGADEFVPAA